MQFARIESRLQNWENKNYQELQKLFVIVKACALLGAFVAAKMISFLVYLGYQVPKNFDRLFARACCWTCFGPEGVATRSSTRETRI